MTPNCKTLITDSQQISHEITNLTKFFPQQVIKLNFINSRVGFIDTSKYPGLTHSEVLASREQFGSNYITLSKRNHWTAVVDFFKDPMILLLLIAAFVYSFIGETSEAIFMVAAILMVSGISIYQERKSKKALDALKNLTMPLCDVIRSGELNAIQKEELVIGDIIVVEEGKSIPADAVILQSNDFAVNESILTGESFAVLKNNEAGNDVVYQGTTVSGGLAICRVTAIGARTELGKIGKSLDEIPNEYSPLQRQINQFVRVMAYAGAVVFIVTWILNYRITYSISDSLLKALTLAMSILPEEIPVAFTTFMAMGAWRLMNLGIIVKKTNTIETLGSATVICTDKTGTITESTMKLSKIYNSQSDTLRTPDQLTDDDKHIIEMAMWASEPIPFDAMEKSIHALYEKIVMADERSLYTLVHEYPLSGRPPLMTHVFENSSGHRIIAAKGAPEAIISQSRLSDTQRLGVTRECNKLYAEGYRVLAVAYVCDSNTALPADQQMFSFTLSGLLAFYDPPKRNMREVLHSFYRAGIDVKIITGDNALTTSAIAKQLNFRNSEKTLDGEELITLNETQLSERVKTTNLFTRIYPEGKLKILNALKSNGEIVAMTGDGVNDAPALKTAHIGIAMGVKGTEIAKEVSALVISDDDLSKLIDAVAMGRKIYGNLKKAIQYIVSIHIPIILTVFIPLSLGWIYPNIFNPVHVIFLELIMGPTCSIIYENEPLEKNAMNERPRVLSKTFFSVHELGTSLMQGLLITAGTLGVYQFGISQGLSEEGVRTLVFVSLISANICLTLVNRSFYYSILSTLLYKNRLIPIIITLTILLTTALIIIPPLQRFFQFTRPEFSHLMIALGSGMASVIWYEGVKFVKRRKTLPTD